MTTGTLTFRPSLAGLPAAELPRTLLCPALRPGPAGELTAALPLHDPNATLLAALGRRRWRAGAAPAVAVFAADPFLRPEDLLPRLAAAGIRRVATYPTIQLHDGDFARALDAAGHGLEAERRLVARLAAAGLSPLAYACGEAAGRALLAAGARSLVLHPGPALSDWRARAAAAAALAAAAAALRPLAEVLLLHRAAGFDALLDPVATHCDGLVLPPA